MVPDAPPSSCWNRPLRTITDRLPVQHGTSFCTYSDGRSILVPIAVVLVLAVGVAVVPAIGAAAGDEPGVSTGETGDGPCDAVDPGAGGDRGATTATSARTPSIQADSLAGSSTHVDGVDVRSPTTQSPANAIVAVLESLSGEAIVFLGAYSRYGDDSPLEHPIRSEIDALASRLPGVQFTAAVDAVDASESTVRYHTRVLEREEVVQTATVWGTQRLFPAGTDSGHFEALAAVRDDSRAAVLRAIDRNEPATVSAIADSVDRAPSTVSHHLSALESADLIDRERDGQSVNVSLAQDVRELLDAEGHADADGVDAAALELVGD